jgi:tRNA/rRNA methyltransferase
MTISPSIILVRPQMGENIGAAARAMANFGVRDLRLVAPRDGWPNPKASDTAGKALDIIDDAKLYETTNAALADCQFVLATTARARAMQLPVLDMRDAMAELHRRTARGERCAVMFGPERTGLENDDVTLADAVVSIPVAPEYASLNVGQAVVVACYEWWMGGLGDALEVPPLQGEELPATRAQLDGLFGQLETELDTVNFWRVAEKKEIMWRNIRTTLVRAGMSAQEVATWRGIIRALRGA